VHRDRVTDPNLSNNTKNTSKQQQLVTMSDASHACKLSRATCALNAGASDGTGEGAQATLF
jgi:hypothetical protein